MALVIIDTPSPFADLQEWLSYLRDLETVVDPSPAIIDAIEVARVTIDHMRQEDD